MRGRSLAKAAVSLVGVAAATASAASSCNPFPSLDGLTSGERGDGDGAPATEAGRGDADAASDGPAADRSVGDDAGDGGGGEDSPDRDAPACTKGTPLTSASQPTSLAAIGGNIVWTSTGDDSCQAVSMMPGGGGTPLSLGFSNPGGAFTGLVADGLAVYWEAANLFAAVAADGGAPPGPGCTTKGLPGGAGKVVGQAPLADGNPLLAALSPTTLYYYTPHPPAGPELEWFSRATMADAACPGPSASEMQELPDTALASTHSMALLDGDVFYGTPTGIVRIVPQSAPVPVSSDVAPRNIVGDDAAVYWTNPGPDAGAGTGEIKKYAATVSTLVSGRSQPYAIAVDDSGVYWSELDGQILRVAKGGGAVELVGCVGPDPVALALDPDHVYYATNPPSDAGVCFANGTIGSLPKPK